MKESKQYILLRKLLKAIGLPDDRIDDLITLIQSWLTGEKPEGDIRLPYRLRNDFLSPAELNFYRVLHTAVSDWAIIFTKVNLGDLFYAQTGDRGQNQTYRNKINRKHVDFLLCDLQTVQPVIGVELDDKSHRRPDRQKRDAFVDRVFAAAGLPLVHVLVQRSYHTGELAALLHQAAGTPAEPFPETTAIADTSAPNCPKCGTSMVLRTARSGKNKGGLFWGCPNYPHCRSILPFTDGI
ncbi:MAG: DUF2726 domain-containing protein [Anaerolineae bacterium]